MLWLAVAAGLVVLALAWACTVFVLGSANRRRRVRELGLEARFNELDRLAATGDMPWHEAKRTQRVELRLAEYEDEIRTLDIPPGQVAVFEPADDDGGVEREALETLGKRGVIQPAPKGHGFILRRPSSASAQARQPPGP